MLDLLASFPHEAVPDGTVFGPHHGIYGLLATLVGVAIVWDDYREREPVAALVGVVTGLFGFLFVWPFYPAVGAALALGGPLGALVSLLRPSSDWWGRYPAAVHGTAVAGILVGLDDYLDHAFAFGTPLDLAWRVLGVRVSAVLALGAVGLGVYLLSRRATGDTDDESSTNTLTTVNR